jgi:hypothetical protein
MGHNGLGLGDLRQPGIQLQQPRLGVIDGHQIVVDDDPLGVVCPREAMDPLAVRARPVASLIVQAASQQQLAQPMPTPLQIFPGIVARARQVAHGLVFRRWRLHRRQQPRAPQLGQLACIAAIRLHPLAGLPRNQCGGHHLTTHSGGRHLPWQGVATQPGFIEHVDRAWRLALELPHEATHGVRVVRQLSGHRLRLVPDQHRDEEVLLVRVDAHVRSNLFHDRLPSMRLWRLER